MPRFPRSQFLRWKILNCIETITLCGESSFFLSSYKRHTFVQTSIIVTHSIQRVHNDRKISWMFVNWGWIYCYKAARKTPTAKWMNTSCTFWISKFTSTKRCETQKMQWYKRCPLHKLYWLNPCWGDWDKDIRNVKNLQISSSTANYDPRSPFHTDIPKDSVLQLYNSILHNPAAFIHPNKVCIMYQSVKFGSFRNSCQASSLDGNSSSPWNSSKEKERNKGYVLIVIIC